jgi:hypothetical protein
MTRYPLSKRPEEKYRRQIFDEEEDYPLHDNTDFIQAPAGSGYFGEGVEKSVPGLCKQQ